MGEEISEGNTGEEQRPVGTHGRHAAYILHTHTHTTHLAKPPDLERDRFFPLAEERSHGGNDLQPESGTEEKESALNGEDTNKKKKLFVFTFQAVKIL